MKTTQDDILAVWRCIGAKIKGRGKVLNEKEVEVDIAHGARSHELELILDPGIIKAMGKMVTEESKKLVIKNNGKYHLLRYLALCGGVDFRPRKIRIPDKELFYSLGYIFQQTLRNIKRERVDEEKKAILSQAEKIVEKFPKKRITSVYYGSGLFHVKVNGNRQSVSGTDTKETISNLRKFLGLEDKKGSS